MATHHANTAPRIELAGRQRAIVRRHRTAGVVRFVKALVHNVIADDIMDIGAMLAYYAVLSLFPMLVFVVAIAMLILPDETVLQGLAMATQALPQATGEVIATQVMALMKAAHAGFAIGGAALALWGASRGMVGLMTALNTVFDAPETRSWWKRQLLAFAVTVGVAALVVLALGLLVVGPLAGHWLADRFGLGDAFDLGWTIGRWVGAGLLVMFVWAVIYKYLPNTKAACRLFTVGSVAGMSIWLGISYGFGLYLAHFDRYTTTYGALGGAIIFLTWLWLSAIALLFGAEINHVIAELRSCDRAALSDEDAPATTVVDAG